MNQHSQPEIEGLRERIARIVDPLGWQLFDEVVRCQLLPQGDGPPPELINPAAKSAKERADESFVKADVVLALLSLKKGGGLVSQSQPVLASNGQPAAEPSAAEKPEPNPEWEAKADAAHEAIRAEVGEPNPFDTLTMLERWTAHAEPADSEGRISFSRAMLDSAQDALKVALRIGRNEYLRANASFVQGAQEMREMQARFVEQGHPGTRGGPHVLIAQSIRANWNPSWGPDPGRPRTMRDDGWLGPALHDKAAALTDPAESSLSGRQGNTSAGNLPPAEANPPPPHPIGNGNE